MSTLRRLKPYKARNPRQTIELIKGILRENRLGVREVDISERDRVFFACHVHLTDPTGKKVYFGSNGKGMTREYALASAYGELMERLQNRAVYMANVYYSEPETPSRSGSVHSGSFRYAPDAKLLSVEELVENSSAEMAGLLRLDPADKAGQIAYLRDTLGFEELVCVPFFAPFENTKKWLPFRLLYLIVRSNGMCSGNTKQEALIQGICEILERLVQKRLYTSPFTPPTVPDSYFEGTDILRKIEAVEEKRDLEVTIKDCSLGKGLPVIGVLLVDEEQKRYHFHLGSDPSPITALERCLAEAFQAGDIRFKPLLDSGSDPAPVEDRAFLSHEFHKAVSNLAGQWPRTIFGAEESYEFTAFEHPVSQSDDEDLTYLMAVLSKNGHNLLVRDVSFLGQPAFWTYVPGEGEILNTFGNARAEALLRFEDKAPLLHKLPKLSNEQVTELAQAAERFMGAGAGPLGLVEYFRHLPGHPICDLRDDYLLFLLYLCAGDYAKADEWFEKAANPDATEFDPALYRFLKAYLKLRREGRTLGESESLLAAQFGQRMVDKHRLFLKGSQADLSFPTCFDCEGCRIASQCTFQGAREVVRGLNEKYAAFAFDQGENRQVFEKALRGQARPGQRRDRSSRPSTTAPRV